VRVNRGVWLLVCLFLAASLSVAQSPNGTISGIVLDPSGGLIVGANVLIINNATGVEYPGKANGEGYYVVPNIPPGTYRIQVSNSGFKTIIKPDIVVHVEDALAINFTLPIGAASEIVTVQGGAPLINTENASVGTVIDRNFVESLPLNGRSFNTLLQLTPGVVIAPAGQDSPGQFSIAGQRTDGNNFTVDGVSANFGASATFISRGAGTGTAQAFSALGGTSSLVSVEALQEFRIETSSFAPEFGRSPGGQVIMTTRSGDNDFHGGVYEYFRNTVMDANNWFNNQNGLPRSPEHHNDFGGFLGFPIRKDKTFVFASYEGARLELPETELIQVPSVFARTQASAAVVPFLDAYPQPNGQPTSPTAYSAPFTGSFSNAATLDAGSIRIDHTLNDRFSIFGRFNDAPSAITMRNVSIPNNPETVSVNTLTLTGGLNMQLSAAAANALRANYSSQSSSSNFTMDSLGGAVPISPELLVGNLPSTTSFGFFEAFDLSSGYFLGTGAANRTRQFNLVDDFSRSAAAHQLKFGGDFRAIYLDLNPYKQGLEYFANSVEDLIITGQAAFLEGQTAKQAQLLSRALSLYAQDTWKATSRLTLTYGVRWELSPAPSARGTTTLAAWANVNNPSEISLAPASTPLWKTTYDNFAPRLGIAYRLTKQGDFVVRVGGGIFYDLGVGQAAQLGTVFPNFADQFYFSVPLPLADGTPFLPPLTRQPPYPPSGVQGYSPDLRLPRSYQWNLAVEKSFAGGQAISASYVGQAGRNLLRQEALFQPNANFQGDFQLWQEDAFSNYNALQLQFRRPLASHLQALVNYTWSHSLDNASNDVVTGLSNTIISAANDYSSSDFDVRQSFSAAVTYAIPQVSKNRLLSRLSQDWSIDTVIVARTGFPFNAAIRSASLDPEGLALSRPDLITGEALYLYGSQCATTFQSLNVLQVGQSCPGGKGLNPNAFSIPSTARQGTEGRNDIRGFGLTQVDLSIARVFPITERVKCRFRTDAFNVLNHPNFSNPSALLNVGPASFLSGTTLNNSLGGLNPLFQEGGPRSLQLSLRLEF
jgi:hypothetical protein